MKSKQCQLAFALSVLVFAFEYTSCTVAFTLHHSKFQKAPYRNSQSLISNPKGQNVINNNNVIFRERSFARYAKSDDGVSPTSDQDEKSTKDMDPLTKASWYAVEAFGKLFGSTQTGNENSSESKGEEIADLTRAPLSIEEALVRIKMDNDRSYFLSGEVDRLAYDEQCVFSDPFVSFAGRDRFVDNLSNLGSFITEYDAKMLKYDVIKKDEQTQVQTKVMVKLELNLPWKPILAWPWGVTYDIDEDTFLIKTHAESWNIEPLEGVKQIFRKSTLRINKK
eukprot:CAMPEP_0197840854 /NCGR_PEP_ID=MMETSP1437-20131217/45843_1 /TAXON_ID=49252 ORGANISM="Eucampia antarctica, Strain CCMP1452" /NCGR_SAMPLE_ID=MMETSP1437 /ASSEMBLY_ACC=CAM_ASM_001096 /LENGTH=279 /DNA_ID=CAMNT_0043450523 /DNA_START=34 /DNA_END=873 /DNA_ORIENTATION=-